MSASVASITGETGSLLLGTDHREFPLSAVARTPREMVSSVMAGDNEKANFLASLAKLEHGKHVN